MFAASRDFYFSGQTKIDTKSIRLSKERHDLIVKLARIGRRLANQQIIVLLEAALEAQNQAAFQSDDSLSDSQKGQAP